MRCIRGKETWETKSRMGLVSKLRGKGGDPGLVQTEESFGFVMTKNQKN